MFYFFFFERGTHAGVCVLLSSFYLRIFYIQQDLTDSHLPLEYL